MKKNVVFFSGSGLSKESGISTFRDSEDSTWNKFVSNDVCTRTAWDKNPSVVQDFYNMRRIEVLNAKPNKAHMDLAEFEQFYSESFNITHITQNVDNLLEVAGCNNIIHIHGNITKARSSASDDCVNPKLYDVGRKGLNVYMDIDENGFPLRPHVVLFGESLHDFDKAIEAVENADYLVVIGTSLSVQPASLLPNRIKPECKLIFVDPIDYKHYFNHYHISEPATIGVEMALDEILLDTM